MAIEVREVTKSFETGRAVLAQISLTAPPGSILAIIGRSGCGKSTLLNIIAGFATATVGEVMLEGAVGYVTQDSLLLPWRTALENALLPIELRGAVSAEHRRTALELLHEFDIGAAADQYRAALSGGMRQRVALARTLIQDAPNILLDEPFSALDFDIRLRLAAKLRAWIKEHRNSAIFVTHQIDEAMAVSDQIFVIAGKPARVSFEAKLNIPESERTADAIRERDDARAVFREIYRCLGTEEAR